MFHHMAALRKAPFSSYRSALVTGASSGIGAAIANAFLKLGLTVYGTSRTPPGKDAQEGLHWLTLEADRADGIRRFIGQNRDLLKEIDVLVNNCGGGCFGDLSDFREEVLTAQVQLLLTSPMELTRTVLAGMRERGRGAIINISSLAAEFPLPYQAPYSGAKGGLSQFTQSLMLTEPEREIIILDVQPGDIATDFNRRMAPGADLPERQARVWREVEHQLAAGPPAERVATDVVRALKRGRSRRLRTGGFFQCRIAPLGFRLLPRSALLGLIRQYYGIRLR